MSRRKTILFLIFTITVYFNLLWLTSIGWGLDSLATLIITILAIAVLLPSILRNSFPVFYFSMMLKLFPRRVAYYTYRGAAYIAQKQDELALKDLNRAVELGSNMVESYTNRGQIYYNRREYSEAIQDYNYALSLNPHFAIGYNNRGWAYLGIKEYRQAIQDFDRSMELYYYYYGPYYGRGLAHFNLNEYSLAIRDFGRAISLSQNKQLLIELLNYRGFANHSAGKYPEAVLDYQTALDYAPQNAVILTNLGFSYVFLKEYQKALQACNQAIALNPKNDPAYNNRGKVYLGLDNLQQARADFAKAVEIDPEFVTHTWYLEWVRLCQEPPAEDVAKRLEVIAEKNGKHPQAYNCKGVAAWIRDDYEHALQEFEQSIQIRPIQWGAYFWKGMALTSLGRDEEAKAAIQAALNNSLPPILLSPLRWVKPALYQELVLAEEYHA